MAANFVKTVYARAVSFKDVYYTIQNDIDIKSLQCIWGHSQDKYPVVTTAAHKTMSCFGFTYLAESSFSDMGIIKSDARNRLTNEHINQCLKTSVSSYLSDFKKIAKSTQSKITLNHTI